MQSIIALLAQKMGMYSQNQKLYVCKRKAQLKFNNLTISNTAEGCVNRATFLVAQEWVGLKLMLTDRHYR